MVGGATHDFDFNHGDWVVTNKRLVQRGANSHEWEVFTSYEKAQLWMGGMVSIDESDFPTKGFRGMSLRTYNPQKDEWAIYWINSGDGILQPPVFGRFEKGVGIFTGDDTDGDRPVKVKFHWSRTDTESPRWSQSFSYDDGNTWETNWIMEFARPE
ncbi:hypothetical protein [Rhizobium sp. Root1220]|uniref:hypothetical protein n=1 Tax=Rhizobium sp. Root1220 TaxID=1736432 RepID=UPI0007010863|nr:hypothetical protein [Rhizobium sp. Root1220]KQV65205.1 hypothetical protein ASC90_15080 [Rhizobium sp. Root1220]